MTTGKWRCEVVFVGVLLLPTLAHAQASGSIAGVVRDTSGAVMPGVTVEAASPALIEKVRSVVTDESGQYRLVDLRPGVYSVTFTLPGFRTMLREGIELTTGFTATVNAELAVGALEETVTVTGASPVVDTQNVRKQNNLSRELLDTLPTGKSWSGVAALTVGVVAGVPGDVGGSKGESSNNLSIHNSRSQDMKVFLDGMTYNYQVATGSGAPKAYAVNQLGIQELVLEVGAMSAESETGGIQQNAVPKDGGNTFHVSAIGDYTGPSLNANNLGSHLRDRGLTLTNSIRKIYDSGVGVGGPFKRDKLWFYGAFRKWNSEEYLAGKFFNKSTNPLFYEADLSRQAYLSLPNRDTSLRLTWQATAKQRITTLTAVGARCLCPIALDALNASPEAASNIPFDPVILQQATWTYPATDRLLLQIGATLAREPFGSEPNDTATVETIPIVELSTGFQYAAHAGVGFPADYGLEKNDFIYAKGSLSYITGSHAFKTGYNFQRGLPYSINVRKATNSQAISYQFRNGVPAAVVQYASPHADVAKNLNLGLYVQDQWTLKRVTATLGLRYDRLHGSVPAQTRPGGLFVPAQSFEEVDNVPNWHDLSPRLGVAWNLLGTGKTAIKASFGRYVLSQAGGLTRAAGRPAAVAFSTTRVWNDVNGDFVPQDSELGPSSNQAFGTVVQNTRFDPSYMEGFGQREYNWETSVAVEHEPWANVGVSAGYFRRWYGNFVVTDNLLTTPADFSPYCVTAPTDARLGSVSGSQLCGLYDITPSAFGRVDNLVVSASNFGDESEVYDGVDVNLASRFGQGGLLNGGVSLGRTAIDRCITVDSPQQGPGASTSALGSGLYQCRQSVANNQFKINGAYPLPWDLQVSGTYQNLQGPLVLANLVYTNAQIAPSLGRNLGQCRGSATCTGFAVVSLLDQGTQYDDRYNQLDLRLTKILRIGQQARLRLMADAYNVTNSSSIVARNNTYGPTWGRPLSVQLGRLFKFGAQFNY